MYIFGGNGDKQTLNDVQQYDFGTKTWAKIKSKGKTLKADMGKQVINKYAQTK